MKAEIKMIHSPDIDLVDGLKFPEDCSFLMELNIGPKGIEGSEIFQFMVYTKKRMIDLLESNNLLWAEFSLVINDHSWDKLESDLSEFVNSIEGKDWEDIAEKLDMIMHWEFRHYKP